MSSTQKEMDMIIRNQTVPTNLKTSDFDYALPPELIAQHPTDERDAARLMVLDRKTGSITHRIFRDILDYISPEDVLVINDSKVIPARLYGTVAGRPDAPMEILLLRQRDLNLWETLVKPGKRARIGMKLDFGEGRLEGEVTGIDEEGNRLIRFSFDPARYDSIYSVLHEIGIMPLPPYISEALRKEEDYQTVYARDEGSVAAPTAGLHFTNELLDAVRAKGTDVVPVMLHVGLGTFRPVKAERIEDHVMHTEFFSVSADAARRINERRTAGGRVICVGTTSCRTLESASDESGMVHPMQADTGIFIYPGYRFKCTDALITNFHLPQSTLLMLISAFYDAKHIMEAYHVAVNERYRFFSFGDAMMIL